MAAGGREAIRIVGVREMLSRSGHSPQEVISRQMLKLAHPVSRITLTELSITYMLYESIL